MYRSHRDSKASPELTPNATAQRLDLTGLVIRAGVRLRRLRFHEALAAQSGYHAPRSEIQMDFPLEEEQVLKSSASAPHAGPFLLAPLAPVRTICAPVSRVRKALRLCSVVRATKRPDDAITRAEVRVRSKRLKYILKFPEGFLLS